MTKPRYRVVVNHEEQYSIVAVGDALPRGFRATSKGGTKQQCLDYIEEVWTDMRPTQLQALKGRLSRL